MTFQLGVQNTSNQSFNINSLAGELYVNGTYLGNVGSWTGQVIPPNAETIIELKVRLSPLAIISDIIDAIKNKTFKQTLELNALANVDQLQIPINVNYTFKP